MRVTQKTLRIRLAGGKRKRLLLLIRIVQRLIKIKRAAETTRLSRDNYFHSST